MIAWTLVFHILGIVGWVGGLLVVTLALAQHAAEASADARASLERFVRKILRSMVHPGIVLVILSGIVLVTANPSYYLHAFWLRAKLALVVILIALYVLTLARFRAVRRGTAVRRDDFILLHVLIALVFLSILIAALPGEVYFP
jgi:putative membrane protein